jgi:hypothetical protein
MKKLSIILFSFLLFNFFGSAVAQTTTSSLNGVIYDENNVELPGANVILVHEPTGTKYGAATNLDGRFNLVNLRVGGPYTVTVSYVVYQEQLEEET